MNEVKDGGWKVGRRGEVKELEIGVWVDVVDDAVVVSCCF